MRPFKRLGILIGSMHIVLYFAVPVYASYLDKFANPVIGLPVMFFFGYWWPILVFFAFAPRRFYDEPESQKYIRQIGRAFKIPDTGIALRVVSFILLWPFTIINLHVFYEGLQA